jgi:hypothetical protein
MEAHRREVDQVIDEKIARYAEGRDLWTGESLSNSPADIEVEFQPQINQPLPKKQSSVEPVLDA